MFAAVSSQHDGMRRQWFMLSTKSAKVGDAIFAVVVTIGVEDEQPVRLHRQRD